MRIDGIIFDLDGTLWDSSLGVSKTWTQVLSKYNYERKEVTVEELSKCMGKQLPEIAEILFPNLDNHIRMNLMDECCKKECEYLEINGGVLYNKLEETLNALKKKYKLFIVSNCQSGYIESFLKAHKLSKYFDDFECPGVTGLSKGANNKLIMERNNLKNPIYVGDTQGDADSAKYANIPFVYAAYGFGNVEKYDYKIEEFQDLLNIF